MPGCTMVTSVELSAATLEVDKDEEKAGLTTAALMTGNKVLTTLLHDPPMVHCGFEIPSCSAIKVMV